MAAWLEALVIQAHDQLLEEHREILWGRGASEEQIDLYRLGYLDSELPEAEYPQDFLEWWNEQERDDVFVFPLTNTLGQVKGLQLRYVDRSRKGYTDFISIKEEPVLFGLGEAMKAIWEHETICVVEGVFDLFPVQRHVPFCVSTLHAGLSGVLVRVLKRLVQKIWFLYDMDREGQKAVSKIYKRYGRDFEFHNILMPKVPYHGRPVKDPGELWEVWGDARLGVFLRKQFDSTLKLDPIQMET